jgi:carbamoylphosphate synthase small subunit
MTGYQEILTDPSYAGQIITFAFPHIGNVGTNDEDVGSSCPACRGLGLRDDITRPANGRAQASLDRWLKQAKLVGMAGSTRAAWPVASATRELPRAQAPAAAAHMRRTAFRDRNDKGKRPSLPHPL